MTRRYHSRRTLSVMLAALTLWVTAAVPEEEHGDPGDEHGAGHEDEMPEVVHFTAVQRQALGIATTAAGPGPVTVEVRLVGEVGLNLDRTAHVTSRVPGVVIRIARSFGERVEADETLAVLDSRDLAQARAHFLTAHARERLAETTFAREETLWNEQISAEREYLTARQALAEARISRRSAEQMLHALGVGQAELDTLSEDPPPIARYELTSPIGGTIIDRHVTVGQMLSDADPAFLVADLDSVWVDLAVHLQHVDRIRAGQPVRVRVSGTEPQRHTSESAGAEGRGRITYLAPVFDSDTRTATARVVLANDGRWRPGMPVTAWVGVEAIEAPVTVPATAIHDVEGRAHVFVDSSDGLHLRPVTVGRRDSDQAEIVEGLAAGERIVHSGGVHVKAAFLSAGVGGHDH